LIQINRLNLSKFSELSPMIYAVSGASINANVTKVLAGRLIRPADGVRFADLRERREC